MHTRSDIPALSSAYAMAVQYGCRDEGVAIAAEMMLAEEMERADFVVSVLRRVVAQDIGDELVAAFRSDNIAGVAAQLASRFEDEARAICANLANAEH